METATGIQWQGARRASNARERISHDGNGTVRKVGRRLMWYFIALYVVSVIDRANIGFASFSMNRDLGLRRPLGYEPMVVLRYLILLDMSQPSQVIRYLLSSLESEAATIRLPR
uniref:Uncharacterized protein n=1 Tax=Burkholderia cenocepacia TaxID=95486 RepID=A0A071MHA8_9BURK